MDYPGSELENILGDLVGVVQKFNRGMSVCLKDFNPWPLCLGKDTSHLL